MIFQEYISYAESSDRSSSTGLGLAICRAIIAQHEGCIWAENRSSGPSFSFVLPYNSSQSIADAPRDGKHSEVA